MASIVIRCPRTGMEVPVGIEIDEESFASMPNKKSKMTCPACGAVHVWSKNWARLREVPPRVLEHHDAAN